MKTDVSDARRQVQASQNQTGQPLISASANTILPL
jgi:hypothetical protein